MEEEKKAAERSEPITSSQSPIEQARELARRIDEGNRRYEELIDKNNALLAREILGGKSDSSFKQEPQKTEEEIVREDIMRNANYYAKALGRNFQ